MSLLPTEDQELLRAACREVLDELATAERLRAVLDTPSGHDLALWKEAVALGWVSLALPEAAGGLDGGLADLAVVVEECGRALQPSAITAVSATAWVLARHLPDALAPELLAAIASGAVTVVGAPAAPAGVPAASGTVLTGASGYVADAPSATHLLVEVDTVDGPALAVVQVAAAGLRRRPRHTIDLTRRYEHIAFDGVSATALLPGGAADLTAAGVVLQCAESLGVAARALDLTVAHVVGRTQFDRVIGSFQAVKHRLADMHIELAGARAATADAARAVDAGRPDAAFAVHAAASWTGRAASMITSNAVQLHGGIGFTWEHDLHLLQRRAKANELLLGTPAWHEEQLTRIVERDS